MKEKYVRMIKYWIVASVVGGALGAGLALAVGKPDQIVTGMVIGAFVCDFFATIALELE